MSFLIKELYKKTNREQEVKVTPGNFDSSYFSQKEVYHENYRYHEKTAGNFYREHREFTSRLNNQFITECFTFILTSKYVKNI